MAAKLRNATVLKEILAKAKTNSMPIANIQAGTIPQAKYTVNPARVPLNTSHWDMTLFQNMLLKARAAASSRDLSALNPALDLKITYKACGIW